MIITMPEGEVTPARALQHVRSELEECSENEPVKVSTQVIALALIERLDEMASHARLEGRISESNQEMWDDTVSNLRAIVIGGAIESVTWDLEDLRNLVREDQRAEASS